MKLPDVTFLIALKVDSQDRIDNLDIVIDYLKYHFDAKLIISEQSTQGILKGRYDCTYIQDPVDIFFNRQRGVNVAASVADTPIIAHYDADILLPPAQITTAAEAVRQGMDFILPYDGNFFDIPKQFHQKIKADRDITFINPNDCTLFTTRGVGGVVFFNRESFWKFGGANENFQGLGYEDNEMFDRFRILGASMGRVTHPLFHLNHERKETSFNHNPYGEQNKAEYVRICQMSKEQLQEEIKTWKRTKC